MTAKESPPELPEQTTRLLALWREGRGEAREELIRRVYSELRTIAAHHLRGWRGRATWQPTALVNEAMVRMLGNEAVPWNDRTHFIRVAAVAMRQILVDQARRRKAGKRGGGQPMLELDEATTAAAQSNIDLQALDEALRRLEELDPQQVRIVELRYFVGLSIEETGEVLGLHPSAVNREWAMARAWLRTALEP